MPLGSESGWDRFLSVRIFEECFPNKRCQGEESAADEWKGSNRHGKELSDQRVGCALIGTSVMDPEQDQGKPGKPAELGQGVLMFVVSDGDFEVVDGVQA